MRRRTILSIVAVSPLDLDLDPAIAVEVVLAVAHLVGPVLLTAQQGDLADHLGDFATPEHLDGLGVLADSGAVVLLGDQVFDTCIEVIPEYRCQSLLQHQPAMNDDRRIEDDALGHRPDVTAVHNLGRNLGLDRSDDVRDFHVHLFQVDTEPATHHELANRRQRPLPFVGVVQAQKGLAPFLRLVILRHLDQDATLDDGCLVLDGFADKDQWRGALRLDDAKGGFAASVDGAPVAGVAADVRVLEHVLHLLVLATLAAKLSRLVLVEYGRGGVAARNFVVDSERGVGRRRGEAVAVPVPV